MPCRDVKTCHVQEHTRIMDGVAMYVVSLTLLWKHSYGKHEKRPIDDMCAMCAFCILACLRNP